MANDDVVQHEYLDFDLEARILKAHGKSRDDIPLIYRDISDVWEEIAPRYATRPIELRAPILPDSLAEAYVSYSVGIYWTVILEDETLTNRPSLDRLSEEVPSVLKITLSGWIQREYADKERSIYGIAYELSRRYEIVKNWIRELGIPIRPLDKETLDRMREKKPWLDRDWLYEQYVTLHKKTEQIADETGLHPANVQYWFWKHEIRGPMPSGSEPPIYWERDLLHDQCVVKGKTASEIAKEIGAEASTVRKWMKEYGFIEEEPKQKEEIRYSDKMCLACGRPLPVGKRKWCGREDCGGWNAVHPPVTLVCEECGLSFETYKGSGRAKCDRCRNKSAQLRTPSSLSVDEIERFIQGYVRIDEAREYLLRAKKHESPNIVESETVGIQIESETAAPDIPPESVTFDIAVDFEMPVAGYNPNYCKHCDGVTDHGQYGHCQECGRKNPDAITVCHCTICEDYTLNDATGICLRCNKRNPHYRV